jgi:hypothetical protein
MIAGNGEARCHRAPLRETHGPWTERQQRQQLGFSAQDSRSVSRDCGTLFCCLHRLCGSMEEIQAGRSAWHGDNDLFIGY